MGLFKCATVFLIFAFVTVMSAGVSGALPSGPSGMELPKITVAGKVPLTAPIIITSPKTGAQLQRGKTYTIAWKPFNAIASGQVRVVLLRGDVVERILADNQPISGTFDWKISYSNYENGADYRISVNSVKDGKIQGTSGSFAIFAPEIKITSPAEWTKLYRAGIAEQSPIYS